MTVDLSAYRRCRAPTSTHRLVPARYPPVAAFEDVADADDLPALLELEGWTDDRLVTTRLSRLDRTLWVFGRPNASVVMAAFLYGSPGGQRFSSETLGAWYASSTLHTAALEIANGLRSELALSGLSELRVTYCDYEARLTGDYVDIVGRHPEFHHPDPARYPASQAFGDLIRVDGPVLGLAGIRYESVRHRAHHNWVCFDPRAVQDVVQAAYFRIGVRNAGKVMVEALKAPETQPSAR